MDSIPQLTNISRIESQNFQLFHSVLICPHFLKKSGELLICLYRLPINIKNNTGPKNKLINIFIFLFNTVLFILGLGAKLEKRRLCFITFVTHRFLFFRKAISKAVNVNSKCIFYAFPACNFYYELFSTKE